MNPEKCKQLHGVAELKYVFVLSSPGGNEEISGLHIVNGHAGANAMKVT